MNILIVDDIATNRKLLGAILESEGHGVIEANDGVEAMAILSDGSVDAIISDILMPRMDGYRFCYEVRANDRFRHLPFIFHTSSYTSPSDAKLALDMGADKFLTKPAPASDILKAVEEAMTVHRAPFTPPEPAQELNLMKEYNQQLVTKLEEKNSELTARNEELHTMHAHVQHLLKHSPAVVYQLRIDGPSIIPLVISENVHRLLGVTVEECLGPNWWENHVHPDDKDYVLAEFSQGLIEGDCSVEYRLRHADGGYRWIEDNNRVVASVLDQPTEVVGVWTDITERKEAEEKIDRQLRELQRWREVTLNREDRVQALKREVNEALQQAGKPARYAIMIAEP